MFIKGKEMGKKRITKIVCTYNKNKFYITNKISFRSNNQKIKIIFGKKKK